MGCIDAGTDGSPSVKGISGNVGEIIGEKAKSKVVLSFFWKLSNFKIYRNANTLFNPDGFFQISVFGTFHGIFLLTLIGDFETLASSLAYP